MVEGSVAVEVGWHPLDLGGAAAKGAPPTHPRLGHPKTWPLSRWQAGTTPTNGGGHGQVQLVRDGRATHWVDLIASIVLLTKTGPRCISFRCKVTVSFAQGAVYDAEADVADPVFVKSTIFNSTGRAQSLGVPRTASEIRPILRFSRESQEKRTAASSFKSTPTKLQHSKKECSRLEAFADLRD